MTSGKASCSFSIFLSALPIYAPLARAADRLRLARPGDRTSDSGQAGAELITAPATDAATLARLAAQPSVAAIMTTWGRVTAEVIAAAPGCRIIARLGIGLDNIDVAAATARGIVVTNVPDYCLTEVAEHALALILALGRKVAWFHAQTKAGLYDLQAGPPLRRLAGQTLGIVGLGNIGRTLAAKAQALGMRVIATSRSRRESIPGVRIGAISMPCWLKAISFHSTRPAHRPRDT